MVGRPDTWAGLFVRGELIFGLLLALGLFTPIAAWGTMWLSGCCWVVGQDARIVGRPASTTSKLRYSSTWSRRPPRLIVALAIRRAATRPAPATDSQPR